MKLIVCLDQEDGLMFNDRRQSKDRMVRQDILKLTENSRLWMNAYSYKQFTECEFSNICVDEAFLHCAADEDYCFLEADASPQCIGVAQQIIIYRWDRVYPASVHFPVELLQNRWRLIELSKFHGYSHEEITREVYSV